MICALSNGESAKCHKTNLCGLVHYFSYLANNWTLSLLSTKTLYTCIHILLNLLASVYTMRVKHERLYIVFSYMS